MPLEDAVGAFLVVGDDVFMALRLEPVADAELQVTGQWHSCTDGSDGAACLILYSAEEAGLLLGRFTALVEDGENLRSGRQSQRILAQTNRASLTFMPALLPWLTVGARARPLSMRGVLVADDARPRLSAAAEVLTKDILRSWRRRGRESVEGVE